jgi:phosphoheptose isomerase
MKAELLSQIETTLNMSADVKRATAAQCSAAALSAAQMIAQSLGNGGKLMLCGNGGSAGDCQHIAAEFTATLDHQRPRPGLAALALTTDTSFITAYANDFGFEGVFARQVQALGRAGDVLIGISTSGTSKNVVAAIEQAKSMDIKTIALTGSSGGTLAGIADLLIAVPSEKTMHIQEGHIALGHVITAAVEQMIAAPTE